MEKLNKRIFTVWVGGTEVNDFYLDKNGADSLSDNYKQQGYDDVVIEELPAWDYPPFNYQGDRK